MAEDRDNCVYLVEADPEAVARAIRRLQVRCRFDDGSDPGCEIRLERSQK